MAASGTIFEMNMGSRLSGDGSTGREARGKEEGQARWSGANLSSKFAFAQFV